MGSRRTMSKMMMSATLMLVLALANAEVAQNNAQSLECTPEGRPKVHFSLHSFCWTWMNLKVLACCAWKCSMHSLWRWQMTEYKLCKVFLFAQFPFDKFFSVYYTILHIYSLLRSKFTNLFSVWIQFCTFILCVDPIWQMYSLRCSRQFVWLLTTPHLTCP